MSSYKYFVGGFQLMLVLVFHEVDSFGQESAENPQIQSAGTESISDTEPVLTKEIAERFMLKKEQVILDVFKSITIDAAKVLSASDNFLSLESLTDLPVEAAKYLTLSESSISLRALKEISLELAVALSESQGGFLDLSGLTKLPDEAAMALTKFDGLSLYLGGLTSMSDEVAEAFGMYKGDDARVFGSTRTIRFGCRKILQDSCYGDFAFSEKNFRTGCPVSGESYRQTGSWIGIHYGASGCGIGQERESFVP
jgi:hypothetical protein